MLITAAEALEQIPQLSTGAETTLIESLITACGAAFARRCGYPAASAGATPTMESTSYVIEHDGPGGRDLTLKVWPATAVSSVYDDDSLDFDDSAYLVASDDYALVRQGTTLRLKSTATHGNWGRGEGRIRIAFTAGFATVPADLKKLCAMAVRNVYNLRPDQGTKNVSAGGATTTYDDAAFLPPWITGPLGAFTLPGAM